MADDLAFLFSDPSPNPTKSGGRDHPGRRLMPHAAPDLPGDIHWMTLRQAHNETSIPVATLRKWAKKGKVRARLVRTEGKDLRLVSFGDVVERARSLSRAIAPVELEAVIDLRDPEEVVFAEVRTPMMAAITETHIAPVSKVASASHAPEPVPPAEDTPEPVVDAQPAPQLAPIVPEGSILVPLDAWDRMLGQLGNLHEAGQQLAEARERAAKAETEAEFLKERVREMRKRLAEAELALDLQSADQRLPEAREPAEPVLVVGWRRLRDRWRAGR